MKGDSRIVIWLGGRAEEQRMRQEGRKSDGVRAVWNPGCPQGYPRGAGGSRRAVISVFRAFPWLPLQLQLQLPIPTTLLLGRSSQLTKP